MLKTLPIAALLTLAVAGPAAAAPDTAPQDAGRATAEPTGVAATFGNTVMSIYPDGRSQKIWIHPDGTWTGQSRRGIPLAGRWNMKGDRVCLRQSKPPTLPISFCQSLPKDPDVGLTSHDLTGQTIRLQIVKGITTTGT